MLISTVANADSKIGDSALELLDCHSALELEVFVCPGADYKVPTRPPTNDESGHT